MSNTSSGEGSQPSRTENRDPLPNPWAPQASQSSSASGGTASAVGGTSGGAASGTAGQSSAPNLGPGVGGTLVPAGAFSLVTLCASVCVRGTASVNYWFHVVLFFFS